MRHRTDTYCGLDLETSGLEWEVNVPIQIGLALESGAVFQSLIGGWDWKLWEWDGSAADVHRLTFKDLDGQPPPALVARRLLHWLDDQGVTGKLIPVGWNVGQFDMQFLRYHLPYLLGRFSRHVVELNSLCAAFPDPAAIKLEAKAAAAQRIGDTPQWHTAGYDALAALHTFHWLRDQFRSDA